MSQIKNIAPAIFNVTEKPCNLVQDTISSRFRVVSLDSDYLQSKLLQQVYADPITLIVNQPTTIKCAAAAKWRKQYQKLKQKFDECSLMLANAEERAQ